MLLAAYLLAILKRNWKSLASVAVGLVKMIEALIDEGIRKIEAGPRTLRLQG